MLTLPEVNTYLVVVLSAIHNQLNIWKNIVKFRLPRLQSILVPGIRQNDYAQTQTLRVLSQK